MIKKLIYMLILIIMTADSTFAIPKQAKVEYSNNPYSFAYTDKTKILKQADLNYRLHIKAQKPEDKTYFLDKAMRDYYILIKIDQSYVQGYVGLARVYDEKKLDRLAKEYFSKALNIDAYNSEANFYFAEYYFKRNDFLKAHFYYKIAYDHGLQNSYELNYKLGVLHEKLADLEMAKFYYLKANSAKQKNTTLLDKIRTLDDLNYSQSQYYLFNKTNQ